MGRQPHSWSQDGNSAGFLFTDLGQQTAPLRLPSSLTHDHGATHDGPAVLLPDGHLPVVLLPLETTKPAFFVGCSAGKWA